MPDVLLEKCSKQFAKVEALRDIDLQLPNGTYTVLLGSTGAGKTTLLRLIGGMLNPDSGRILFDGVDVTDSPPEERRVGYFPQTYALFPHLNAWRNVAFPLLVRGVEKEEASRRAQELLSLVGLKERAEAFPQELSGGMQQRIALARALASPGKLILLDEPLGALDAILRLNLRYELRRLQRRLGLTVLHVTHDQDEALSIADQIIVMRRGEILQQGTSESVYDNPKNIYVGNFLGEMNFLEGVALAQTGTKVSVEIDGMKLDVDGHIPEELSPIILATRPEHIQLAKDSARGAEWHEGKITGSYFLGSSLRVEVELSELLKIAARIPITSETSEYATGERVWVRIPPEHALIFPYPDEGLLAAMKVE